VAPSTRQSIFPSRRRCVICVIRRPQPVRFWWANGRHSSGVVNARARVFLLLFSGESSLVRISALGQHQHLRGAVEGSSTPGRRLGHPQDDPCRACFQQARNRLPPRRQSHPTDRRSARRLTSASRLLNSFCLRFSGLESSLKAASALAVRSPDGLKPGITAPLHTAAATSAVPSTVLGHVPSVLARMGRVWRSRLARDPLGAAGQSQDHKERGKPPPPGHRFVQSGHQQQMAS